MLITSLWTLLLFSWKTMGRSCWPTQDCPLRRCIENSFQRKFLKVNTVKGGVMYTCAVFLEVFLNNSWIQNMTTRFAFIWTADVFQPSIVTQILLFGILSSTNCGLIWNIWLMLVFCCLVPHVTQFCWPLLCSTQTIILKHNS